METLVVPLKPVLVFVVVLARVGGMMSCAPFWSHRAAPAKVRIVLAFMLAFVLAPLAYRGDAAAPPTQIAALAVVVAGEFLIGFAFGFAGRLVFSAFEVAAHVLSSQMGFTLAATVDPSTRAGTTALGTAAQSLGLLVLLGADGHHWTLWALARSFTDAPPGSFVMSGALADLMLRLSADALAAGIALAAPAIVVLLAVEFGLALAGRAAPQLQVMLLGFPIKIAVGLWLIGASLYFLPGAARDVLSATRTGFRLAFGAL